MRRIDDPDVRSGRNLLIALTALLAVAVCAFYLTGPVNKVPVMANAPGFSQPR